MNKLSIIIPVYNGEKFLKDIFEDLTNQTADKSLFEVLFIDDASSDNSVEILNSFAKEHENVRIFAEKEHKMQGHCRNVGLDNATGDYIAFADCDDRITLDFVEVLLNAINEKECEVLAYGFEQIDPNTDKIVYSRNDYDFLLSENRLEHALCGKIRMSVWCYLFNAKFLKEKNIHFLNKYAEDNLFMLEVFSHIKHLKGLPKNLYYWLYQGVGIIRYLDEKYFIDQVTNYQERIDLALKNNFSQTVINNIKIACFHQVETRGFIPYNDIQFSKPFDKIMISAIRHIRSFLSHDQLLKSKSNKFLSLYKKYANQDKPTNFVTGLWNFYPSTSLAYEFGLRMQNKFKQNKQEKPLVTVITVVRNAENTLKQTIESVKNQSYDNIEYIVIDGASTDKSIETLKEYENFIDYCISEQDEGIYYAMNKGLSLARGEYIIMLNADDYFELNALELLIKNAQKTQAAVIFGGENRINSDGTITTPTRITDDRIYLWGMTFCHNACIISQKVYEQIGYFDTSYSISADYKFILEAYDKKQEFSQEFAVMINFRMIGISSNDRAVLLDENSKIQSFYFPFIEKEDKELLKTHVHVQSSSDKALLILLKKYKGYDPRFESAIYCMLSDEVKVSISDLSYSALVLGNGPSLKDFNFKKDFEGYTTFGMNAAYRYWDTINWYPDYYCCLDLVVGISHKEEIKRLIENSNEYGIKKFLLRDNLIKKLGEINNIQKVINFDSICKNSVFLADSKITTGSHTCAWAAELGFKNIILLGIDSNYVEIIPEASLNEQNQLVLNKTPEHNPNYFFDNYQQAGDKYNIPNPAIEPDKMIHRISWKNLTHILSKYNVLAINGSLQSKLDCFNKVEFTKTGEFIKKIREQKKALLNVNINKLSTKPITKQSINFSKLISTIYKYSFKKKITWGKTRERAKVKYEIKKQELSQLPHTIKRIYLFGIPVVKILEYGEQQEYLLFSLYPFIKVFTSQTIYKLRIFGLQLFKRIKDKENDKCFILGLQIFKIKKYLSVKTSEINSKVTKLEPKFTDINSKVVNVDSKLVNIQNQQKNIQNSITDINNKLAKVTSQIRWYDNHGEVEFINKYFTEFNPHDSRIFNLLKGLDKESANLLCIIIKRIEKIKNAKSLPLNVYTLAEQEKLREISTYFHGSIVEMEGKIFAYQNKFLLINRFYIAIFDQLHGLNYLKEQTLEKISQGTIIDVGGFSGDSCLLFRDFFSDSPIYSFECLPENIELFEKTIELNKLKNVTIVNKALSDEVGKAYLNVSSSASALTDAPTKDDIEVDIDTLDNFVTENSIENIKLIKVDIEGAEKKFLQGAINTIKENRPVLLLSIYHSWDDFLTIKPLIESWNLNYSFKVIIPTDGTILIDTVLICEPL